MGKFKRKQFVCTHAPRHRGFSVIELIAVIVLVAIVGAVIVPRFLQPNAFDEAAAQDGLIATIRAAQQAALGRSTVSFEIDLTGNTWQLAAKAGGNSIRTVEIPARNILLQTGSAGVSTDSCATEFDDAVAGDFELVFDRNGNLTEFTNDGTTELVDDSFNGVRICVNGADHLSVCVSPAGYAYAGNCDE